MKSAAASAALLVVSGCTSAPKADLRGILPDQGTFFLAEAADDSPAVSQLVRDGLAKRGLVENSEGTYIVQAGLAERNLSSGMSVSTAPGEWLHAPVRGAGRVVQFSVTVTKAADGSEVFRATAAKRDAGIDPETMRQLVDAVFSPIRTGPVGTLEAKQR